MHSAKYFKDPPYNDYERCKQWREKEGEREGNDISQFKAEHAEV